MAIRAVIFDFGGVLCFHPSPDQIAHAARFCGVSSETFLDAFWGSHRIEYDAGRLEPADYWRQFSQRAGIALDAGLTPDLVRFEIDFWSGFDQRMLRWVRDLKAHGLRTAVLSNLPRPLGEHLRATPGFLDPFDHITFSYELNLVKPQPAIYGHAVNGLSLAPAETLFLDDRQDNIDAARAAGLDADLFADWETFWSTQPSTRHHLPAPTS